MEGILTWVKQLVYFSVLTSFVIRLVPGKNYEKYFRFVTGMLMLLLFLSPLLKLFDIEAIFDTMLTQEVFQYDRKDAVFSDKLYENSREKLVLEEYEGHMKEALSEESKKLGYELVDMIVTWDDTTEDGGEYALSSVKVVLKEEGERKEEKKEGGIEKVDISLTKVEFRDDEAMEVFAEKTESKEVQEIKSYLGRFYNLSQEHIHVSIQGGEGK